MTFSGRQEEVLVICSFVFSLSSLLSSVMVIMYYLTFEETRKFAFQLVAWTALADSIRCVGNLIGGPEKGTLCEAQGLLKTLGGVASLSWVGCMAFSLHLISSQMNLNTCSLLWKFQIITWSVSTISAILPIIYDLYEPVGGWCWISKHEEGVILRWTSFYGIVWLDIIWICFVYLKLWLSLKDLPLEGRQLKMVSRLYIYPLILIVCYGPASVRRIWDLFGNPPYWLAVVHICFSSLHGLVNAIAYGRNADVRALNTKIMDHIFGDCMGWRKVTSLNPQRSLAIRRKKQMIEFSETKDWTISAPWTLAPPVRGMRVSGDSSITLHSNNLQSRSITTEMFVTQCFPRQPREGEKKQHYEESKENSVKVARNKLIV